MPASIEEGMSCMVSNNLTSKNNKKLAYSLVDRWIGTKLDYSDS